MAEHTFINPYTFVPLPNGGAERFDLSDPKKITAPAFSGEIKCTLITKTQLAVPDKLKNPNASDDEIKEYDFFRLDIDGRETAVIPGSGIRGVIRSVFEVLTDSCMHLNDTDKDYFHTRVNKTTPGIIECSGSGYILYEAERLRDKEDRGFKDDKYFTGKPISNIGKLPGNNTDIVNWKGGSLNGIYLCVDQFRSYDKKTHTYTYSHPSVFVIKRDDDGNVINKISLDKKYVDRLKINVEMYDGVRKAQYEAAVEKMEKRGGQLPVWYWRDEKTGYYYLAPSQYSRAVFVNQPKDLVKNAKMTRCTSNEKICAACALFGFIGNKESRASRIRFTDAVCITEDCFDGAYVLPILSTPRLSSFEFYLNGNGSRQFGPDTSGVTLAGRKFYWHDPKARITADDPFAKAHPKMACKMELVKPDSKFEFSVFFDKITDEQLQKLVFALNLGQNGESSDLCHKIGHGKPLGPGSAKIVVNKIVKRSYENGVYSINDVTEEIIDKAKANLFRQSRELQAFIQRVMNFKFVKNNTIDYPRQQPGGDIFGWFSKNRNYWSEGLSEVKQVLPKITDSVQTLRGQLPK